jgi:hypothetical protein
MAPLDIPLKEWYLHLKLVLIIGPSSSISIHSEYYKTRRCILRPPRELNRTVNEYAFVGSHCNVCPLRNKSRCHIDINRQSFQRGDFSVSSLPTFLRVELHLHGNWDWLRFQYYLFKLFVDSFASDYRGRYRIL